MLKLYEVLLLDGPYIYQALFFTLKLEFLKLPFTQLLLFLFFLPPFAAADSGKQVRELLAFFLTPFFFNL